MCEALKTEARGAPNKGFPGRQRVNGRQTVDTKQKQWRGGDKSIKQGLGRASAQGTERWQKERRNRPLVGAGVGGGMQAEEQAKMRGPQNADGSHPAHPSAS